MIFIASPYTHPDEEVRELRYKQVHYYTRLCMEKGEQVFSPIIYGHSFALINDRAVSFYYWREFNDHILLTCNELRVLKLHGYRESMGVQHEISLAARHGIRIVEEDFHG